MTEYINGKLIIKATAAKVNGLNKNKANLVLVELSITAEKNNMLNGINTHIQKKKSPI